MTNDLMSIPLRSRIAEMVNYSRVSDTDIALTVQEIAVLQKKAKEWDAHCCQHPGSEDVMPCAGEANEQAFQILQAERDEAIAFAGQFAITFELTDPKISITKLIAEVEKIKADAELGRLVRRMGKHWGSGVALLVDVKEDGEVGFYSETWMVVDAEGVVISIEDVDPETVLKAAMGEK